MALMKSALRFGVIGGLAVGGLVLIAGQPHARALFSQARAAVTDKIDHVVDDPTVLREQLRDLERQYPKRIEELRSESFELADQIAQLEQDREVALRVVQLAQADAEKLDAMLAQGDAARSGSPYATIKVSFQNQNMTLDQAYSRATQLKSTITAFTGRAESATQSLEILNQQSQRVSELLAELQTEYADFQMQVAQLDGQIEAIRRNEKLIDMIEAREKAISKFDRGSDVGSADQVADRMNRKLKEQEARMQDLLNRGKSTSYEEEAREMIERENAAKRVYESGQPNSVEIPASTIQITPDGAKVLTQPEKVANAGTIVIR